MKKSFKNKKTMQKKREKVFFGVLIALLVLVAVAVVVDLVTEDPAQGYTITEDGHIHAADGTHIGTLEEMLGEGVVTEDDVQDGAEESADTADGSAVDDTAADTADDAAQSGEGEAAKADAGAESAPAADDAQ